ncbi:MAG: hypothetical protein RRA15_05550 [bacterium]|nr:hypothetical protein [bacterium]MDT8365941.1 hypothetical protein [bacterium]
MTGIRSSYLEGRERDSLPEGFDGIRIGSEFCPQLVPSAGKVRHLSRQMDPAALSLVTPVAGPDEVADVLNAVTTAVSHGWGEVVVNDWGVLNELGDEAGGMEGVGITAGRLLMRFRRGPGVFDSRDESDLPTRRYFAWGPLYDSPFLAFLKVKGVDRIELDPPRHWLPLPDMDGFLFSFHRDTRLIAVSGACSWLYKEDKGVWNPIKDCGRTCTAHKDIVMTSPALKGPLLLRGRAILERVDVKIDELELPDCVDRFIYDRKA